MYSAIESFTDFCDEMMIAEESTQTILKTYHDASEELVNLTYSLNEKTPFKEQKQILQKMVKIANVCIDNIRKDKLSEDESEEIIKLKAVDQISDAMLAAIKKSLAYYEIPSYKMDSIEDIVNNSKRQIMELYASDNVDLKTLQVSKKTFIDKLHTFIELFNDRINDIDKYYQKKHALANGTYRGSIFGEDHAKNRAIRHANRAKNYLYNTTNSVSSEFREEIIDDKDDNLY